MTSDKNKAEILKEIESHHKAIAELEGQLSEVDQEPAGEWPPKGFYATYYVVAGMMLGLLGAMISFIFNVIGSRLVHQDMMQILRVFGTLFIGEDALQTNDLTFLMLVLVIHFSVGAVAGAVFHVIANRFFQEKSFGFKVLLGAGFGVFLWIFNFYIVLSWLQSVAVGQAYILQMMPVWVAILTHVVFGVTLGLLQPIGQFIAYKPATV